MKKMEGKQKEINNNFLKINIDNYDKSNRSFDYSDSKNNQNDIISKAKESIYKFQSQLKTALDSTNINNNKFDSPRMYINNSEQNPRNFKNIYHKEKYYKEQNFNEVQKNSSLNNDNPDKIIYKDNYINNYTPNNTNIIINSNKNNNLHSDKQSKNNFSDIKINNEKFNR